MSFPKVEGYVFTEKLGSGSYSTVYKAYTKIGARTTVAVKCIDKSLVKHSGAAVDNLVSEIRLMKTLTHPHIVHMREFTWDDRNIYIIMEYCCGGDLSKYIHRYGRVPEAKVLYFLQQLASALKFLREKGVVHMDLKPHNLLLHKDSDGKYLLKVGDFGFAQHMSAGPQRAVRGSPLYMAPEMVAGEYDARVDLWSVGVIMYECLFGKAPYSSNTFKELVDKIQRKAPIEIPANASISAGCADLLTRLLQHDPDKRISYEEFFEHEYLDLEHMPSKENYVKAVGLIKQAIDAECAGRPAAALALYSAALRRLVPAARCEPDALRRTALSAKLASYMDRAEEIKRYLQSPQTVPMLPQSGAQAPYGAVRRNTCCSGEASGNSYEFNLNEIKEEQSNNSHTHYNVASNSTNDASNGTNVASSSAIVANENIPVANSNGSNSRNNKQNIEDRSQSERPRGFARFLKLPYLDKDNYADEQTKKQTEKADDSPADFCKIT
ncbi:serine/threonine-protein kinase ULK3 isoform X2 [Zerene cesonia]|uniref:serine/threonine-protein kinase ULK3 isoform X2 n=1 Tax=Zerene cesonia TaxID=33412 RepID=UPI0018E51E21|nr:serine/threonine-protein kinase ULK3 isoform X2 [Zerene cesonia]